MERATYDSIVLRLKRDDPTAEHTMGLLCDSSGTPLIRSSARSIDDAMAAAWYAKAAAKGDAMSQLGLCKMHRTGRGVTKDVDAAAEWCRKAAAQDVVQAQMILKEFEADDRQRRAEQELENIRKRAEQGDPGAQNDLAVEYQRSKQFEQAVPLFRNAAAQGNKVAQFNMGLTFEQGLGVPKDVGQAAVWYLKSAEQGYANAQEKMGIFYAGGVGVPKDLSRAAEWNRKAGAQGKEGAQRAYEEYATERAYDEMVAAVAKRFDVPKSANNICVAGVTRERGDHTMVPEFIAMLAARDTMVEKIIYSEPGGFGGDYALSFKRRADQHDQVKTFLFRKIFVGGDGKIYVNQTPQGDLKTCLVVSRIEYIGGRIQEAKENIQGMVAANLFVDGIRSKLMWKAREKALGGN
jgi:TPR repeat protein